ncbi:hypothetical protein SETIT_6G029800v2 [Setaria italica]|uniref:Uncharacterized protein n=1 Tax=Setaria italica TaxID=4555 RepID=A0A368RJ88_SETIT|nr:hypothetical protein SETIT_6G029800v2 [Setaria italica]
MEPPSYPFLHATTKYQLSNSSTIAILLMETDGDSRHWPHHCRHESLVAGLLTKFHILLFLPPPQIHCSPLMSLQSPPLRLFPSPFLASFPTSSDTHKAFYGQILRVGEGQVRTHRRSSWPMTSCNLCPTFVQHVQGFRFE